MTDDGAETDLDLGHYERFIDENLNKYSNLTTGKVYWNVLNKERQRRLSGPAPCRSSPTSPTRSRATSISLAKSTEADVVITEIGGTTGDIESQPFLEAIRQVGLEAGPRELLLHPCRAGALHLRLRRATSPSPRSTPCKELQGMGIRAEHHRPARRRAL